MVDIDTIVETRSLPAARVRRALRTLAGLSLEDVGRVVGVTRCTVSRWERGVREPRGETRARYAATLRSLRKVVTNDH